MARRKDLFNKQNIIAFVAGLVFGVFVPDEYNPVIIVKDMFNKFKN